MTGKRKVFRRSVILAVFFLTLLGAVLAVLLLPQRIYPDLLQCATLVEERSGFSSGWGYPLSCFPERESFWVQTRKPLNYCECIRYDLQSRVEKPLVGISRVLQQVPTHQNPSGMPLYYGTVSPDVNRFIVARYAEKRVECFDAAGKSGGTLDTSHFILEDGIWLPDNRNFIGWNPTYKVVHWEPFSGKPPVFTPRNIPIGGAPFGASTEGLYFALDQPANVYHGPTEELCLTPFAPGSGYRKLFTIPKTYRYQNAIKLSPDGRRIVWIEDRNAPHGPDIPIIGSLFSALTGNGQSNIDLNVAFWVANVDGSERRCLGVLTDGSWGEGGRPAIDPASVGLLAFSSDSSRVAFYRQDGDRWQIFTINLNDGR